MIKFPGVSPLRHRASPIGHATAEVLYRAFGTEPFTGTMDLASNQKHGESRNGDSSEFHGEVPFFLGMNNETYAL